MRNRLRIPTACTFLLCCIFGYPACGVEIALPGIKIDQLLHAHTAGAHSPPRGVAHLNTLLQGYFFPAAHIEEQVSVVLTEEIELDLSDTDESANSKEQVGLNKKHVHFTSRYSTDPSRIHLKPSESGLVSEPPHNEPPGVMAKALRVKLSRDALHIANAHHNSRTREATTCLCVVLRDEEKRVKKLVFHNGTGQMLPSMRKEVNALAYGIRNAHLAHAEAQFIDFLLYRARQRTKEVKNNNKPKHPQYTHILGMGCSRKHC